MKNIVKKYLFLNPKYWIIPIVIISLNPSFLTVSQTITPNVNLTGNQFHVESGQEVTFNYTNGTPCGSDWQIVCKNINNENFNLTSGVISNSSISLYMKLPVGQYSLTITYDECESTAGNFTMFVHRSGAHVMLVLDRSGSMRQEVIASPGYTKWDVLKNSVSNFLTRYREWEDIYVEDKIGVVYFDHDSVDYNGPSSLHIFNPQPVSNDPYNETNGIRAFKDNNNQSIMPRGTTCVGGAIMAGYNAFEWNNARLKHIILFSDGIQNTEPWVDITKNGETITQCLIHKRNPTNAPDGFLIDQTLDLCSIGISHKFRIHTISIGDNAVEEFMEDISKANPIDTGISWSAKDFNTNIWIGIENAFENAFVKLHEGSSPSFIDRSIITIDDEKIIKQYHINNSCDRVLIKSIGSPKDMKGLRMKIIKENQILCDIPSIVPNIHFFITRQNIENLGLQIGGIWEVIFSGNKGSAFSTTCIVNDEYIDYECDVDKLDFIPGEPVTCKLKVRAGGKPVGMLDKAMVYMLKPGTDVNDLFSNTPMPTNIPTNWPSEPGNFAGQDKYEKLIALDSSFVNKLKLIEFPMPMINTGNNTFTTLFTDTKESGVYQFIFKFKGHDEITGTYERYYSLRKVIDFGVPDLSKSVIKLKGSIFKKYFYIKPVNQFDHLIGPNRLSEISITLNGEPVKLTDNLDGSYTAKAPLFLLFKKKWQIRIDVKGKNLIQTTMGEFPKIKSLFGCLFK
jgi:hypothetical protein